VRIRLTPRENSFYSYFNQAADNLVVGNGSDRMALADKLSDAEHDSDEVTHRVFRQLNTTFVTPFDREDIYRLGSNLDDVMDELEQAGGLINLYGLDEFPEEIAEVVAILAHCARVTAEAMPRLQAMERLEEYWIEANRLENEADRVHRRLLMRLFSGDFDPLTVLKLKEVADVLEDAADAFEHVANAVETIVVKES
jgi:predicted phosphate transport protein (TIGR00153 family)